MSRLLLTTALLFGLTPPMRADRPLSLPRGPGEADAPFGLPQEAADVRFAPQLGTQIPADLVFTDDSGKTVRLGDYFTERPVILVLAYYRCPMLCNLLLNDLLKTLQAVPFEMGKDYTVVTVSFDPREKPELAAAKKKSYVDSYGRAGAESGWHFLTGEPAAIAALTQSVGFVYNYLPQRDEFAHASGVLVLTKGGQITRFFAQVHVQPTQLRLGLIDAAEGKIGSPMDQIMLLCFHYDPAAGKYTTTVLGLVRIAGVATVLGLIGLIVWLRRREARRPAQPLPTTG